MDPDPWYENVRLVDQIMPLLSAPLPVPCTHDDDDEPRLPMNPPPPRPPRPPPHAAAPPLHVVRVEPLPLPVPPPPLHVVRLDPLPYDAWAPAPAPAPEPPTPTPEPTPEPPTPTPQPTPEPSTVSHPTTPEALVDDALPLEWDAQGRPMYAVEAILDHRMATPRRAGFPPPRPRVSKYLVKWRGWADPTWEPAANLRTVPDTVRAYHRDAGLAPVVEPRSVRS